MKKSSVHPKFILSIAILSLCSSVSALASDKSYFIAPVKVTLKQKYENANFNTEEQIQKRLDSCIKNQLRDKNQLANKATPEVIDVNISVEYQRVYNGEAFGFHSSVGSPIMAYAIIGSLNSQEVFKREDKKLIHSYGFFGNIAKSVTMGLEQSNAEDEYQYIDTLCKTLTENITR